MAGAVDRVQVDTLSETCDENFDLHQYTYLSDSAVFEISGRAFDLIHQYGIPPDPISYAVWFTYASNANAYLKRRLDQKLSQRGSISRQDIALIYKNYLEDSYVIDSQQNLGLELETNLSDINGVMSTCSLAYREYAGALKAAKARLENAESAESLSTIAQEMLDQNEKVSFVTEKLQADLAESRTHIQHLNKKLENLQNLSLKDPLTGASNRRAFDAHLAQQIEIAENTGSDLCVAFSDLDHFKRVNDRLGHQIGDVVLKHFAKSLSSAVPDAGIVARYGGEEFALILPGMTKIDAHNLANRICYDLRLDQFLTSSQHQTIGSLTTSFGISQFKPGRTSYELLEIADKKLYEAKNAGRNCVRTEGIG